MGLPFPDLTYREWQPAIATYAELRDTPGEEGHLCLVIEGEQVYEHKNGLWQAWPRFVSPLYGEDFVNGIAAFLEASNTKADAKIVLLAMLFAYKALDADEYRMATDMVVDFHARLARTPRPSRGFW